MPAAAQPVTQPPPSAAQEEAALAAATAEVLATGAVLGGVSAATAALAASFLRFGIPEPALRGAIAVVLSFPPETFGVSGPATTSMVRINLARRAQYVIAAARRITTALRDARSRNEDMAAALADAIDRERRYYAQHLEASWKRAQAAARVDSSAMLYGPLLGWYSLLDRSTTADCRHADGRNFIAAVMPAIGYPGMVHPQCRCLPGPPHPAGAILAPSVRLPSLVALKESR